MKKIYLLALVVLGFSANSFGQVSETATATATIITPIAIAKTIDMNFGNIAVDAAGGTVTLPAVGARTRTAGVTLPATTGTVSAASFDVTGELNSTFAITLPSTVTLENGSFTMTAGTFTVSASAGTLSNTGKQTFTVGATLNVSGAQAPGTYESPIPFTVTVNYN